MRLLTATLGLAFLLASATVPAGELPEIPNMTRPNDQLLIGGQPDEAQLRQAAAAGIEVVVNLRGSDEAIDFDQEALVKELGMHYLHLPIAGAADLTPESAESFGEILETIDGQPALMHCASGNRVGALFALHAGLHEGMETEAAIEYGRARGLGSLDEAVRERLEGPQAD
jgi:uncharacterized protein (TIGR01244 family)